uniref:Small ribosomal subunit protein uS5c n=1 Tax=Harveyella mirabilis TaxID=282355 RepID=A0A3S8UVY1_9FLOR|nr:ribosomal protein S5 [Harveyella mirabilis]
MKQKNTKENTWIEKIVQIKRVTKVVKGGKKLSFRAILIIGNENGKIGVGLGKASDIINAVKKSIINAKKHIITIPLTTNFSIPHPMKGTSGAASIILKPSAVGSGVIAGGSTRIVLKLTGIQNILAKQLGSNNILSNARATLNALKNLKTFQEISIDRNIELHQLC